MSSSQTELFWKVGKVLGAQGVRGEVFVLIFSGEAAWLPKLAEAHFGGESELGTETSYKVIKRRIHHKQGKMGLVLGLEGLTDRDAAEKLLKGTYLYIPDEFLHSEPGEQPYLREYLDFRVLDLQENLIGQVTGFDSNVAQDLLEVQGPSKTHLVPLVKEWIVRVDQGKKEIVMDLPEGLLEVD